MVDAPPGEEPQVVLLEPTNSLLVNATAQQHEQIQTILDHVDVLAQDLRTFKVYRIENVEALDVVPKLSELGFTGNTGSANTVRRVSASESL